MNGRPTSERWRAWVPGVDQLRHHHGLRGDLVAGLVLTALLVPQGMAYAELAGLPPETGLYTTVVALVAYAVFGPSRVLVMGPDSSLVALVAAAVSPLVVLGDPPGRALALAGMLAILMGLICVVAGLARLGELAVLLSRPVRVGYLNGIALVIVASQLPKLFGFSVDADGLLPTLGAFARGLDATNTTALVIGVACLALIVGLHAVAPRFPGVLVAVVGATLAVGLFDLDVATVGRLPQGFPAPSVPEVATSDLGPLFLAALGMAFVSLAETSTLSRTFAIRTGRPVDQNREIVGMGVANVACGVFQGFPVCASSSRTAVAAAAGARSQLTGLVGAALVVLLLVGGQGLVQDLPSTALAAVVIAAAATLLDLRAQAWLWRVRRAEFVLSVAAMAGVALLGVLQGVVVAIVLSLANFVRLAWRPYDAVLGRIADRRGYHDIERHPEAEQVPGLVLYRFDAPLFFANAELFASRVEEVVAQRPDRIRRVVVAAEPVTDIDTTAAEVLHQLLDHLDARGIELAFAELKGPVKDRLRAYELYDRIGDGRFSPTLGTAIDAYLAATGLEWIDPVDGRRDPST